MSVLNDKKILLGVSGGIAAYKSIILLRLLKKMELMCRLFLLNLLTTLSLP